MRWWKGREQDLDDEMRDDIERETRESIQAGMSPEEARFAALRAFGSVLSAKEKTREAWGWMWLERLARDLRHGVRMLSNSPGFTAIAVISLAVGIGANTAIYSLADALLLRPLPVSHPSSIVTIDSTSADEQTGGICYLDYVDIRNGSRSFEGLVAFQTPGFAFVPHPGASPELKMGMLTTANLFDVMGVEPELGRVFRPDEDQVPGRDAVVVLSHSLWANEFASDPAVSGKKVRINGIEFTVIGVAPASFTGMDQFQRPAFFVPIMMWPRRAGNPEKNPIQSRDARDLTVKGRLKPQVNIAQARAELAAIAQRLARVWPVDRNRGLALRAEFTERVQQSPDDAQLLVLLGILALAVLLTACGNVAGLLLSRGPVRAREIALRMSIGAGRGRLIRQLMTESFLLAGIGSALGLGLGYLGVMFLSRIQVPSDLPIVISVQLDRRALICGIAVSALSAILFGLAPAIQTTRTDLASCLKSSTAGATMRSRLWGRNLLVIGQVAASLVLLSVAIFMYRGFQEGLRSGPGFRTDHLLMMSFDPELMHYTKTQTQQFFRRVVERARSVPGVRAVTLASGIPMGENVDSVAIVPQGWRPPPGQDNVNVLANSVGDSYFAVIGIPILRGRAFRASDTANAPKVAIVNEEFAHHYWPGQDAIGKRFRLNDAKGAWVEIVGVAKHSVHLWVTEPPTDFLYFPMAQRPNSEMTLLAESFGDPAKLAAPLRAMVRGLDANMPIYNVRTMYEYFQRRAVRIVNTIIQTVGIMGEMALLLALTGLYGLVAYAVSRRTREIGIRVAVGAQSGTILRMFMQRGLLLAAAGLAAGIALSFVAERALNAIFYGSGTDFMTYALVAPSVFAVVSLAIYIPARRASRVDPMTALRYE